MPPAVQGYLRCPASGGRLLRMTPAPKLIAATLAVSLFAVPASADSKRFGLTGFDAVDVRGDMIVEIVDAAPVRADAEGARSTLETLSMEVQERTLTIRQLSDGPYGPRRAGEPPARIRINARGLSRISVHGGGRVTVTGMRGQQVIVTLDGAGTVDARGIVAEQLDVRAAGQGTVTVAGRARSMSAVNSGAAAIEAQAVVPRDLSVRSSGAGSGNYAASGTARVDALGDGNVTVTGRARCTVRNVGAGTVNCGPAARGTLPTTADVE